MWKRSVTAAIAAVLIMGIQLTIHAASLPRIGDINSGAWTDAQAYAQSAARLNESSAEDILDLRLAAGDEVRIYLTADLFSDENGAPIGDKTEGITLSQIRGGSVTVKSTFSRGSGLVEGITLDYDRNADSLGFVASGGTSYIKIELVEDFVSVKEAPVDFTLQLHVKGDSRDETQFQIAGTLDNSHISVMQGEEYVSLEGGVVAKADGSYTGCSFDLGNGLYVLANPAEGREYYGICRIDGDDAEHYTGVEMCYTVKQVNLDSAAQSYLFDLPELYYVYNTKGDYLGTTEEELCYSAQYYLTKTREDSLILDAD